MSVPEVVVVLDEPAVVEVEAEPAVSSKVLASSEAEVALFVLPDVEKSDERLYGSEESLDAAPPI